MLTLPVEIPRADEREAFTLRGQRSASECSASLFLRSTRGALPTRSNEANVSLVLAQGIVSSFNPLQYWRSTPTTKPMIETLSANTGGRLRLSDSKRTRRDSR